MYEGMTYEAIKEEMLEGITRVDKREGSFVQDMLSPAAMQGERIYAQMEHIRAVAFLQGCTGADADAKAAEEGLTRKAGTKAKGTVIFSGKEGTEIPEGTLCGTASGIYFVTTADAIIGGDGAATVPVEAEEDGDIYNVLAGTIDTLPIAIYGITGVSNAENFIGGAEEETDEALIDRILLKKRTPATSGNTYHYIEWAMEVDGVGNVRVFPLDAGNGTVGVMPITPGGRAPDEEILQAVHAHIEEKRPIGATVLVYAPKEILIRTEAKISLTPSGNLEEVREAYREKLENYIKGNVFTLQSVDYYKCLSMFYEIEGVLSVREFHLNDAEESISIGKKEIQVAGEMEITEWGNEA